MSEILDKEKARQRAALRKTRAYQRLFKSPDGKAVLEDLQAAFGTNKPAFIPMAEKGESVAKYDPLYAAIRDGQRQVLLHIEGKRDQPIEPDGDDKKPKTVIK